VIDAAVPSVPGRVGSLLLAGLTGALFGAGLLVSGLVQPARIVGFLDMFGDWDPTLLVALGAAVAIYAPAFRWIRRRSAPWFDVKLYLPTRRDLDVPLIAGSAVFGIGWSLGGFCPGPGIVSAASGSLAGVTFLAAMLVGMYVQHRVASRSA